MPPADFADLPSLVGRLRAAGCVAAEEEAAELLTFAPDAGTLESWTRRREQGEPLAWLTGVQRFCGLLIRVVRGVYVPRPQSEELARRAAAVLTAEYHFRLERGDGRPPRAADLCTGAGATAAWLTTEVPAAVVVGTDVDRRSVVCARGNGVRAVLGDLAEPLAAGAFDVVTAVAPYVPTGSLRLLPADVRAYEPRLALDGGADGLDVVRRIVSSSTRVLRSGGWLFLELGGDQDEALAPVLAGEGFRVEATWSDEDGDLRGLAARRERDGD